MPTNFPGAVDSYTNPSPSDPRTAPSLAGEMTDKNDAVIAIETKLGIDGSTDANSIDYGLRNPASIDPGHKHTIDDIIGLITSTGGDGVGGKPMTFSMTDTDSSAGLAARAGYHGGEALFNIESATTKFTLQFPDGSIQTRDITADWAQAQSLTSYVFLNSYLYVLLLGNAGTEARIYRYVASNISGGGTQMAITGGAVLTYKANLVMTSNGTNIFINYQNGESANAYRISKLIISGTDLQFDAAVNCGATASRFDNTFAVDASENYWGIQAGVLYQYDITGALIYTSGAIAGIGTGESLLNWTNTFYINSGNDQLFVKLYLPESDDDSFGGQSIVMTAAETLAAGDPVGASVIDSNNVALANWYKKTFSISGATLSSGSRSAYIGDNTFIVVYGEGGSANGAYSIVQVDRATMTASEVDQGSLGIGNIDGISVCSLGTTGKFMVAHSIDGTNNGAVIVGSWDGAATTLGSPVTVRGSGDVGGTQCCNLGVDRAACIFQEPVPNTSYVDVIDVSALVPAEAANDILAGADFSDTTIRMARVDTLKFVIATTSGRGICYEFTAPATLTAGAITTSLSQANIDENIWIASAVDGNFMFLTGNPGYSLDYCSISGTTITVEDSIARSSVSGGSLIAIDATTFYMYESNNTIETSGMYKVGITAATIDDPILIGSRVFGEDGSDLIWFEDDGYFFNWHLESDAPYFVQGMSGNFVGIAQNAAVRGGIVSVMIKGQDNNQSGISPGTIYEVADGSLSATLDVTVPYKVTGFSDTSVLI